MISKKVGQFAPTETHSFLRNCPTEKRAFWPMATVCAAHVILGAAADVVGAVDEGVRVAKIEEDRG